MHFTDTVTVELDVNCLAALGDCLNQKDVQ
jgi:hypothetical protein